MHRRKHSKAYGITWDENADTYTRFGQGNSVAVGVAAPEGVMNVQPFMRRCIINDAGVVQYYLDSTDSTKKENGDASDLTGADGQVMVEIPEFWFTYSYSGTVHTWKISKEHFNGATRHLSFYKNAAWVNNRYIGAYEAVLYDVSATRYTNGLQLPAGNTDFVNATSAITRAVESNPFTRLEVGDKIVVAGTVNNNGTFTVATTGNQTIIVAEALVQELAVATATIETEKNWGNDKLSSINAKAPINYGTRANFRTAAASRGAGWRLIDFDLHSAVHLLYLIEYADFYSQSVIGNGLTDWLAAWPGYNNDNPIENTGNSNGDGNYTNNVSGGNGVMGSYMSYRGIENFYGHVWDMVDGININANVPYISNNDTQFADDTAVNYTALGITLINANGYQGTLEQISRGFLPATIGGGAATKITDYYFQNINWRIATHGGSATSGVLGGAFCTFLHSTSASLDSAVGGRLAF